MVFLPPTEAQTKFAEALGIPDPTSISKPKLAKMIGNKVKFLSAQAMIQNPDIKENGLVTFRGDRYMITSLSQRTWRVTLTPVVDGKGSAQSCFILALVDSTFDGFND